MWETMTNLNFLSERYRVKYVPGSIKQLLVDGWTLVPEGEKSDNEHFLYTAIVYRHPVPGWGQTAIKSTETTLLKKAKPSNV